ncbi:MAG: indole-3-glycerol-phosphate synthase [Gemmatimonadetes bacterium]|nr:indole-3-glycerol-phosphate synthase [Gemmatimonadota bacterium]
MPKKYTRRQTEAREPAGRPTLSSIVARTRSGLGPIRARLRELETLASEAPAAPEWAPAFQPADVSIIAEVKRRSPSAGDIAPRLDPATLARSYAAGGARAISVLTEGPHFGGSLADLEAVRRSVSVPVLRKDFIVDPAQVIESRAAGASAILLIARALPGALLGELARLARDMGLAILVEVHRLEELDPAIAVAPDAIGVNSRDLETFHVDVAGIEKLLARIPSNIVAVAESGLSTRADVDLVAGWGADAVLIGTALAATADPAAAVRALTGCSRRSRG